MSTLYTDDGKGFIKSIPFPHAEKYREHVTGLELIENPPVVIFGRECKQNRDVKFFSDSSSGYAYSNSKAEAYPLTPELEEIMEFVNKEFNDRFNGILINRYNSGNNSIGAHSDDEKGLGNSGIVGIVFGATRKLRIRNKKDKKIVSDIIVPDGYMYHMNSEFNRQYTHEIPVEKKVKQARISLTFRYHTK